MPAPLSLDLRERILRAYLNGEGSQDALAQRFSVNESTVLRLLQRHRETGSLEPASYQHGRRSHIEEHHRALFEAWFLEDPSMTQAELARRFSEATGTPTSQPTVSRALARFGLTRKKSP